MTMVGGLSCHTSLQKSVTDLGMGPARAGEWDMSGVGWCMAKDRLRDDGGSLCFAPIVASIRTRGSTDTQSQNYDSACPFSH